MYVILYITIVIVYVTHWYTNSMLTYIIIYEAMGPLHIVMHSTVCTVHT